MKNDIKIGEEYLRKLYLEDKLSTRDIAKMLNIGQTTVRRKMKEFNIQPRSQKESRKTIVYLNKQEKLAETYKIKYTKTHNLVCKFCGTSFTVEGYSKKNKKFCSVECEQNFRRKLERDENGLIRNTFKCRKCGKVFDNPSTRKIIRHYCDNCLLTHRSESQYKRITVRCGYCKKQIDIIPSRFKSNKINYCSISCMAKDFHYRFSGENSPTWTGGKKHYTGDWDNSRDKARKRDLFKCRRCGISEKDLGKELSVHHIRKYKLFQNKKKANSLHNLVCLCPKCHTFIHSNKNINNLYTNNEDNLIKIILKYSLYAIENIACFIKLRLELCWEYLAESNRFLLSRLKDELYH